jgi:hypothetical protein
LARALRYEKGDGRSNNAKPDLPQNMENVKIQIDGNDHEYEQKCEQCAESRLLFALINFTLDMVPFCRAIAKKRGYELKGRASHTEPGVCYFIPRNYDTSKITIPDDFVFSGSPED